MDMARSLGHVDGGQEEALEALCRAAQAELRVHHEFPAPQFFRL